MKKLLHCLIVGLLFNSINAFGADIVFMRGTPERLAGHVGSVPYNWLPRIIIDGQILVNDEKRFAEELSKANRDTSSNWKRHRTLLLNSEGGDVATAIAIGRLVRRAQLVTAIHENNLCASACTLILAGGVQRYARDGAKLGLHRPYFIDSQQATAQGYESYQQQYNDIIEIHRRYYSEMGINDELINKMTQIPSNKIYWITIADARKFNLLGEDASYAEWKRAHRIATKGAACVSWEDNYFSYCFERALTGDEQHEQCEIRTGKQSQCK